MNSQFEALPVQTERLVLRPFSDSDGNAYLEGVKGRQGSEDEHGF